MRQRELVALDVEVRGADQDRYLRPSAADRSISTVPLCPEIVIEHGAVISR